MKKFFLTLLCVLLLLLAAGICAFVFGGKLTGFILLGAVVFGLCVLVFVMVLRAKKYGQNREKTLAVSPVSLDTDFAVKSLCDAVKIPSVTPIDDTSAAVEPLRAMRDLIRSRFTFTRAAETVDLGLSAIYILRGTGGGAIGLNGHMDVVPAGPEKLWKRPPFSGETDGEYVYGRGAIDMKGQLFALLNAVEYIYVNDIPHEKDIYVLTTHDEETGNAGARAIAAYLKDNGIRLDYIVDEGGVFFDGSSFGIRQQIAFIGINEKGYMDVRLTATETAGHSAIPPKETAIENISKAITGIQYKRNRACINQALKVMIRELIPHMPFTYKLIFSNLWLFAPIVLSIMGQSSATNALIRTTVAPTVIRAGEAYNVLPEIAEAVFNCRINAPDTIESTLAYMRKHMKKRVKNTELEIIRGNEASAFSVTDCPEYRHLKTVIRSVYGDGLVTAPYQVVASTDCHEYYGITDKAYRFVPFLSFQEDMDTIHSENERLKLSSYLQGIEFYITLLRNKIAD